MAGTTTVRLRNLALLLCALVVQDAWACRVAPAMQLMSVDEQVTLASDVSVARVTRATPLNGKEVEYQFFVL